MFRKTSRENEAETMQAGKA